MKSKVVKVPSIQRPIQPSPGFEKKRLSDFKLDVMSLCQYGCRYCSSNWGNPLRINQSVLADMTEKQLGERVYPSDDPALTFQWDDVINRLETQLAKKPKEWGTGNTLVYSMLTDGFSPIVVNKRITETVLRMILDRTSFRIRVLTKNAIVGQPRWLSFFAENRDRFVVGLSAGTVDDAWSKKIEVFTPPPTRRLDALRALQDAGIATYGMLCPVFPDTLNGDGIERLVEKIRPDQVEHVWAEPYNSRNNWEHVRDGYSADSFGWKWFTEVYGERRKERWSAYATELYLRLRDKARAGGWVHKLRYLLYERNIVERDAGQFRGLEGVLLQSKSDNDGKSQNPFIAKLQ